MKTIDTKSVIIGLLFGVCVMLLMGQATKQEISDVRDMIETRRLVIVNDKEEIIGVWGTDRDSGNQGLTIINANHKAGPRLAAAILSTSGGGVINVFNKEEKRTVHIANNKNGGSLTILNSTGDPVVQILADEKGYGFVGAYNRRGRGNELKPAM